MTTNTAINFTWRSSDKQPGLYDLTICKPASTNQLRADGKPVGLNIGITALADGGAYGFERAAAINQGAVFPFPSDIPSWFSASGQKTTIGCKTTEHYTAPPVNDIKEATLVHWWQNEGGGPKTVEKVQVIPVPTQLQVTTDLPPAPIPSQPPGQDPLIQFHVIEIQYRDAFGLGDKIANNAYKANDAIQAILNKAQPGSQWTITNMSADNESDVLTINITEVGTQVIVTGTLILIAALLAVTVIGTFYVGMTYRENGILKASLSTTQEALHEIETILNDDTLTDEQKVNKALDIAQSTPDVVIPPGPGLPDVGLGLGLGAGAAAILIGAVLLMKK